MSDEVLEALAGADRSSSRRLLRGSASSREETQASTEETQASTEETDVAMEETQASMEETEISTEQAIAALDGLYNGDDDHVQDDAVQSSPLRPSARAEGIEDEMDTAEMEAIRRSVQQRESSSRRTKRKRDTNRPTRTEQSTRKRKRKRKKHDHSNARLWYERRKNFVHSVIRKTCNFCSEKVVKQPIAAVRCRCNAWVLGHAACFSEAHICGKASCRAGIHGETMAKLEQHATTWQPSVLECSDSDEEDEDATDEVATTTMVRSMTLYRSFFSD